MPITLPQKAILTVVDAASDPPGFLLTFGPPPNDAGAVIGYARLTGAGANAAAYPFNITDGTVFVGVPIGVYMVWAANPEDLTLSSDIYLVNVTNGADAVATRSRNLVAATIRSLGLPVNVYEQWNTADLSNVMYPCVILSVENVQESREKSLNATDDIGRPVKVSLCDRAATTDHTRLALWEKWRERIERRFHNQQLDMPESYMARVEYNSILDPSLPRVQFCLSEFVIRHITREYRG